MVKNKLIVFRLKNNFESDPVDRLRGMDIFLQLKKYGWNVELFNEQRNIDLLISLDDDYKSICTIDSFNPKRFILDLQDDHLTMNKSALIHVQGQKFNKYRRALDLYRKKGLLSLFFIFLYKKISKILLKIYLRKADYLITSSESLKDIVLPYNSNAVCIPDSIDFELYKPSTKDERKSEISIVWIGTTSNIKYLLLINNVLSRVQNLGDVKIKIITSKQIFKEKNLLDIIDKFEFEFEFIEWDKNTFADHIANSTIGIAPLPVGIAKSTNKILSYMASQIPVVCSGSIDYMHLNERYPNSFYYSDNTNEWYELLSKLISDDDIRSELTMKGYELSKKFSLEQVAFEYEKVFNKVLNEE